MRERDGGSGTGTPATSISWRRPISRGRWPRRTARAKMKTRRLRIHASSFTTWPQHGTDRLDNSIIFMDKIPHQELEDMAHWLLNHCDRYHCVSRIYLGVPLVGNGFPRLRQWCKNISTASTTIDKEGLKPQNRRAFLSYEIEEVIFHPSSFKMFQGIFKQVTQMTNQRGKGFPVVVHFQPVESILLTNLCNKALRGSTTQLLITAPFFKDSQSCGASLHPGPTPYCYLHGSFEPQLLWFATLRCHWQVEIAAACTAHTYCPASWNLAESSTRTKTAVELDQGKKCSIS